MKTKFPQIKPRMAVPGKIGNGRGCIRIAAILIIVAAVLVILFTSFSFLLN